jgi:hypothetical protein
MATRVDGETVRLILTGIIHAPMNGQRDVRIVGKESRNTCRFFLTASLHQSMT